MEKKSFSNCKRFTSGTSPCPHKDEPVMQKAMIWGGPVRIDLTAKDFAELEKLCSNCGDYIEKTKPRII